MSEKPEEAKPPQEALPEEKAAHPVIVRFHESESGIKCIFRGRMDAATVAEMEPDLRLRLAAAIGKRIVYELSSVDYVASSFLRLCIMAAKTSGGNFAIVNPSQEVKKVLRLAGLDGLVKNDY